MAEEDRLLAGAGDPILPPRLQDAGLEDCKLPPESIAEAFSLAIMAVSSRLPRLSLSDDEDDDDDDEGGDPLAPRGGYVEDAGPTCGAIPDALIGAGGGRGGGGADEVVVVGGSGRGGGAVVVVGRGDEEDRVVVVGEEDLGKKRGKEKGCVDGIREGAEEEEEEEEEMVEKAILVEDFA